MRMIWNKGHRIRASDKHLVYHFSIETLLFVFVAVLLLLNSKQLISFSELPDVLVDKMAVWDDYETDYTIFSVCGIDIRVLDDELAEALKKLPERKRNTLLMYYFLEMTESEIANLQKITQSGVFRNRHHALETMKKILKEEH